MWGFRLKPKRDRDTFIRRAGRWDSVIYMTVIAVGVPFMGLVVTNMTTKWIAAAILMALSNEYWAIEINELVAQMKTHGEIDRDEVSTQKKLILLLYVGAAIAFVLWLLGVASSVWWGPSYTIVEGMLIVHTIYVAWRSYDLVDRISFDLGQGTQRGKRIDQVAPPVQ